MYGEMDALSPTPGVVSLASGTQVEILDLKSKQLFKMLKIIIRGPGLALINSGGDILSGSTEDVTSRLIGFLIVSIPEAYEETLDFVASMIRPAGLRDTNLDASVEQANSRLWDNLRDEMANPEPEDFITLIEAIVRRESADLAALGKKVMTLFTMAKSTSPASPTISRTSQVQNMSGRSAASTTPSAAPMGGPMRSSMIYPSDDFDNSPQPLPPLGM